MPRKLQEFLTNLQKASEVLIGIEGFLSVFLRYDDYNGAGDNG